MADPAAVAPLPIDPLLPEVVARLREAGALVLEAPPGAGKTTRVPRALLSAGFADEGEIVVLQPRRLPARLAAERVAAEWGERVGETIGYNVRFEEAAGPRTRVRFITEGLLTRRLLADPQLRGVGTVLLDEFHERHVATDLALGAIRALRAGARPDLRVCVMSATLAAEPVAEFLNAPRLRSEGRAYPVEVEYAAVAETRPLADQVTAAIRRLASAGDLEGDVLVFLPGAGEIRRAAEALRPLADARGWLVLPLHGELPLAEQERAVRPAAQRKIILATNVAETSVTIDGVVAVVDSGLARLAAHSPWTGLPTLAVGKISQAAAIQRAGRAGRTRPGRAVRLYTRYDFESRRAFEAPEIERHDLSDVVLALAALGVPRAVDWGWFETPPGPALGAAESLLRRLEAVDTAGALTATGRTMLRFPVHPRLARLMVEADRLGVGSSGAVVAALLSERDVRERARVRFGEGPRAPLDTADLLELVDAFEQVRAAGFRPDRLRAHGLDERAVAAAERVRRQLARLCGPPRAPLAPEARDEALTQATLVSLSDRVGKRRGGPTGSELVLAAGGTARIGPVPPGEWMVAVDAHDEGVGRGGAVVRVAAAIAPEALLELGGDLSARDELVWNAELSRVERLTRLAYGALTLEEDRRAAPPSEEASALLLTAAKSAGLASLLDGEAPGAFARLLARVRVLVEAVPELAAGAEGWLSGDPGLAVLAAAVAGRTSFAELRRADLVAEAAASLPAGLREALKAQAPERIRLPGGREVAVHYEPDRPPWIESRLQDFFGMARGPAVARGRVPVVVHLLAPNGRAVQVTRDLEGFWRQHYPGLRRELGRRYPRHAWPEDGATATPPAPKPPRAR